MESNQQIGETFYGRMLRGFSRKVLNLINLNIDGKVFKEQETLNLSLNDCPSLSSSYHDHIDHNNKMTRQEYLNSVSEGNDCTNNERQCKDADDDNMNDQYNINHKHANHHQHMGKGFNSAFRLIDTDRNDIANSKTIHKESSYLVKRQRDAGENIINHSRKPRPNEEEKEKNNNSNNSNSNLTIEDISMRPYDSYLSNQRYSNNNNNNKTFEESTLYSISNRNTKTLGEIKEEIEQNKKIAEKKIDDFKQKNAPIRNPKQSYEEKKKILIDYYTEKAKSLKEVTIMIERERIKRESNFNHLKSSKNEMIHIKGKEKVKPKDVIIKQTAFCYDKVNKVDKAKPSSIIFESNSVKEQQKEQQPKPHPPQEEDKKDSNLFGLARSLSFGAEASMFSFGLDNDQGKDTKPKSNLKKETNLFSSNEVFDKANTSVIDFKPDPSNCGQSSLFDDKTIGSIVTDKDKTKEKPKEKSWVGTIFADNKESNGQTKSIFGDNKINLTPNPTTESSSAKNTNSLFGGIFGLTDNANKDTKPTSQKPTDQVPNAAISFFNPPNKSPMKGDTSIFKSNNPFNENKQETPALFNNPFSTPKQNNISQDDQVKELLKKNESTMGSLLNANNPFINTSKTEIATIFKSPDKPNTSSESLVQNQSQQQLFNQSQSLFSPNKGLFQSTSNTSSVLFAPNKFANPITQNSSFK